MVLGSDDYGLVGNFNFQVTSQHYFIGTDTSNTYYRFYIGASASVKVRAFGITLAGVSLGFEVRLDTGTSTTGSVPIVASVYMSVDFGLFSHRRHRPHHHRLPADPAAGVDGQRLQTTPARDSPAAGAARTPARST